MQMAECSDGLALRLGTGAKCAAVVQVASNDTTSNCALQTVIGFSVVRGACANFTRRESRKTYAVERPEFGQDFCL